MISEKKTFYFGWIVFYSILLWSSHKFLNSGFIYVRDVGYWLVGWQSWFYSGDFTRYSPHFLNGLSPYLVQFVWNEAQVLTFLFQGGPLISLLFVLLLGLLALKWKNNFLFVIPIVCCSTFLRGFIYSELAYSAIFGSAFIALWFSEFKSKTIRNISVPLIWIIFLASHQAIFICIPVILFVVGLDYWNKRKEKWLTFIIMQSGLLGILFHLYWSLNPVPPVCQVCAQEFSNTFKYIQIYSCLILPAMLLLYSVFNFSRAKELFVGPLFLAIFINLYNWHTKYFELADWSRMWNMRTMIPFILSMATLAIYLLARRKTEPVIRSTAVILLCCSFILVASASYINRFESIAQAIITYATTKDETELKLAKLNPEILKKFNLTERETYLLTHFNSIFYLTIVLPTLKGMTIERIILDKDAPIETQFEWLNTSKINWPLSERLRNCTHQKFNNAAAELDCSQNNALTEPKK